MNEEEKYINKVGEGDDGSLAYLGIGPDPDNRFFNCDTVKQSMLVNMTFWVLGYIPNVPTKYKKQGGQTIVHIKFSLGDPESQAKKFFTGSSDILYKLRCIDEREAFPRKVTMRSCNNRYYFE